MNIRNLYFSAYCRTCHQMKGWDVPESAFDKAHVITLTCPDCQLEQFIVHRRISVEITEKRPEGT